MGHLIITKYEFGVIEVYLKTQPLLLIENISNPVIVLRNTYRRSKKSSAIPSLMVMTVDILECKRITERRLVDLYIAMGIPLCIITPGKIKFSFSFFFCCLSQTEYREEHECKYNIPVHIDSVTHVGIYRK